MVRLEHFAVYRGLGTREQAEKAMSWFWFHIRKGTYGAEFLRSNQRSLARSVDQALKQLGDLLLAPIAGALATTEHVVVVPHGLLHGVPSHALAYIDWSQQEFGIAAALSGDTRMQEAYASGDPYLTF